MISSSNIDALETLRIFKSYHLSVALFVPTPTGLNKSIMDAPLAMRKLLSVTCLHKYETQKQGSNHKTIIDTYYNYKGKVEKTRTSFYRPETKDGDPRFWVYNMASYSNAFDLHALCIVGNKLIIINCTQSDLPVLLTDAKGPLSEILTKKTEFTSPIAEELYDKIKDISSKGFIKTMRAGDGGWVIH